MSDHSRELPSHARVDRITVAQESPHDEEPNALDPEETPQEEVLPTDAATSNESPSVSMEIKTITAHALGKMAVVLPKIEPLTIRDFFKIASMCAVSAAAYILLFTKMGFGLDVFLFVSQHLEQYAWYLTAALVTFILCLYLLDFSYWDSPLGVICNKIGWGLFLSGCMALVFFLSGDYPYAPICLYAVLTPIWLLLTKYIFYGKEKMRTYVCWMSGPLFSVSLLVGITWFIWTFLRDENEWNDAIQIYDAEEAGCGPDFDKYPHCEGDKANGVCFEVSSSPPNIHFPPGCNTTCTRVYDECLNPFVLWVGPLLVSLTLCFLCFFCTFLRPEQTDEGDVMNFGKLWLFLLFAMWLAAALAGISSGVATALLALTLASFAGSVVLLVSSVSRQDCNEQVREYWERTKTKYGSYLEAAQGLAVLVVAPLALVYVGLSFVNQSVRRLRLLKCSKSFVNDCRDNQEDSQDKSEENDWMTKVTREQVTAFKSWDRSKIFTYAIYWGIAFMTWSVIVAKLVVLLLSWLVEKTSGMSLGAATGILIAVGLILFLLPPVPGLPIYTTFGLVVVAIEEETGRMGYAGAIAYAVALSLALKLGACALQQKVIGELLAQFVSVRKLVGINTAVIRTMRLVLATPGMSMAKVCILIGGPDWPTSVLCGIMGLDLMPILLGTLPVILLVLPMTLGGSFLYMATLFDEDGNPRFPWAGALSTTAFALATCTMVACMLSAAHFIEKTVSSRADEVNAVPVDEEVQEADEKEQRKRDAYARATQWQDLPLLAKLTITLSLACMVACCYMVMLFPHKCFVEYSVSDKISGSKLNGDWKNFFLPLGRFSLLIFLLACTLLGCFQTWAKHKACSLLDGGRIHPNEADVGTETNPVIVGETP